MRSVSAFFRYSGFLGAVLIWMHVPFALTFLHFGITFITYTGLSSGLASPLVQATPLAQALPNTFTLSLSGEELMPDEPFEVVIYADSVENLQYIGIELEYDTSRFDFQSIEPGTIFAGQAVYIADHLPDATLGASVSSTAGEVSGTDTLMHLHFLTRAQAESGPVTFVLEHSEALDEVNVALEFTINETVSGEIPAYLTDAGMISPGSIALARGNDLTFQFRMEGNGIIPSHFTDDGRLKAEIGIISLDEADGGGGDAMDPAGWPAHAWSDLDFTIQEGDSFYFESGFPSDVETGTWLAAGRFQMDDQSPLFAGYGPDSGGILDGVTYTTAVVTVTAQRVTLAHWSFNSENWIPETGVFYNLSNGSLPGSGDVPVNADSIPEEGSLFTIAGAGYNGWTSGTNARAPGSNNWHDQQDENENAIEKYWLAVLSGEGYGMYEVSYSMNGSGTGPGNFRLEYSSDGENWAAASGSEIEVSTSFSNYMSMLPAGADNSNRLYIRWFRTGSLSINGDAISSVGSNRIDEVRITGVPVDETEIMVWPGDADNSGDVSEADVLPIGYYWMSHGPNRIPKNIAWQVQPVIQWIPQASGLADTNGDGKVDYRDIMAIGRNFGSQTGGAAQKIATSTIKSRNSPRYSHDSARYMASVSLPSLLRGEQLTLVLNIDEPVSLLGLAARFQLTGLSPDSWVLTESAPEQWADNWIEKDRLISFEQNPDPEVNIQNSFSTAWAHKGITTAATSKKLVRIVIRSNQDWYTSPELGLTRLSLMDENGVNDNPDADKLIFQILSDNEEMKEPEKPVQTRLYPNFPNPFNPSTIIPYDISETEEVRITIHDVLGRQVATLIDEIREPGSYEVEWNSGARASGLYLYQLDTPSTRHIRPMILLK